MTSPVESYQQAIAEIRKAKAAIEAMASRTGMLREWRTLTLANTPGDIKANFPFISRQLVLDMNDWPDARKVTQLFANYYNAKRDLESIWQELSEGQRIGLQPPKESY